MLRAMLFTLLSLPLTACVSQPQPQYYPQPQAYPQQPQAAPYAGAYHEGEGADEDDEYAASDQGMPPAATGPSQLPPAAARTLTINGVPASQHDLATLDALERQWGGRLASGHYWYDNTSGAAGHWGGPMLGVMPPGLQLGGQLPPNASGGGHGRLTAVFINGRELHPEDVAQLRALVGEVPMGRWWVDGHGNFGAEGGPMMGNLNAQPAPRGGRNRFTSDKNGSVFVGRRGCVSVTGADGSTMTTGC